MDKHELRAVSSLAAVFSVRLLGLFMIYPVFATYAKELSGATPYKIGLALGIYGLSQGILQIPFGMLSDRIGRKIIIVSGLAMFGIGSAVAALSTSMDGVIAGRLLQGMGAVGSVILALVADLTAEENRTKAMAMVGVTIGVSFMLAIVTGPIIASFAGLQGIFWLMVLLAVLGMAITQFVVPDPLGLHVHRDAEPVPAMLASVLTDGELLASQPRHFRTKRHADGELPGGAWASAQRAQRNHPRPVDRLSARADCFACGNGPRDYRR